jgi:hypothetical protein
MKDDHEPGRCGACHEETEVRYKNLYTIGSEGTWLCMPCEMVVVNLIQSMSQCAMRKNKQRILAAKRKQSTKEI